MKLNNVQTVFHYLSLHASNYYIEKHDGRELSASMMFSDCLVRLPLFYDLSNENINYIVSLIKGFCSKNF